MTRLPLLLPAGRALATLDVLLAVWVALWIWMGLAVADNVDGLKELSSTVRVTGGAIEETGRTVGEFDDLPVIGDRIETPADRIEEAGRSAVQSGRSSRESIENLSLLLGLAVAVIPSLPILGFYLPLRFSRRRESRALGRAVRHAGDDPTFRDFLARRAIESLSYRRLRGISEEPWRDVAEGRCAQLAAAELERLGVYPGLPDKGRAAGA